MKTPIFFVWLDQGGRGMQVGPKLENERIYTIDGAFNWI